MPIGKNSINRVKNNGYSNVKTSAPDMENSVIAEEAKPKEEKPTAQGGNCRKPAGAKTEKTDTAKARKKTAAKKTEPVVKSKQTVASKPEADGEGASGYINIGGELPIYLL